MVGLGDARGHLRRLHRTGNPLGLRNDLGRAGCLRPTRALRDNGRRAVLNPAVHGGGIGTGCIYRRAAAADKVAIAIARIPAVGWVAAPIAPILFPAAVFAAATMEPKSAQNAPDACDNAGLPRRPTVAIEKLAREWPGAACRPTARVAIRHPAARPACGEATVTAEPYSTTNQSDKEEVPHRLLPLILVEQSVLQQGKSPDRTPVARHGVWSRDRLSDAWPAQSRKSPEFAQTAVPGGRLGPDYSRR